MSQEAVRNLPGHPLKVFLNDPLALNCRGCIATGATPVATPTFTLTRTDSLPAFKARCRSAF